MKKKDWFWILASLFVTIGADQLSKYLVLQWNPRIHKSFFHIILHFNKGAMLGLFSDLSPILRIVSLSTGGAFLLFSFFILQYLLPTRSLNLRIGMSILIGGVLGNVIDRIVWGYVVDFIIIGNKHLSTGIFNFADILQWLGYAVMGYAIIKDNDSLWPKENLRQSAWINPRFQMRYCYILLVCGLGFSVIAGVFSYTFLRFVVIDLVGNNRQQLDHFLTPFLVTFSIVSLSFTGVLFLVGLQLSHRIVGPVHAFNKFLDHLSRGNKYRLRLRRGDELPELEEMADKLYNEFQPIKKTRKKSKKQEKTEKKPQKKR